MSPGRPLVGKLAVFGVGLIGGSFALALKRAGAVGEVVGSGRGRPNLETALACGVIDRIAEDDRDALVGADLVLLATPVGQMGSLMARIAAHLEAGTVITDAGSTKADVVDLARAHLVRNLPNVVPAHPIAGAEKSGAAAARADLFDGRHVILAPQPETAPAALSLVRRAWESCGMRVTEMGAQEHDRTLAAVSHLPHVLSFALVHELAGRADAERLFSLAAGGFRDFTRIAASSPEMWRDICVANARAILEELDCYQRELDRLRALLESGDGPALEQAFSRAREARARWLKI